MSPRLAVGLYRIDAHALHQHALPAPKLGLVFLQAEEIAYRCWLLATEGEVTPEGLSRAIVHRVSDIYLLKLQVRVLCVALTR